MRPRLERVTITGADDHVDPAELIQLSIDFPFVEWGLLVSRSRFGTPRYPTPAWLTEFTLRATGRHVFALHLCGEVSRAVMAGRQPWEAVRGMAHVGERVQLNGFSSFVLPDLLAAEEGHHSAPKLILQCADDAAIARGSEFARKYARVRLLYDASGGLGERPVHWPMPLPNVTGFAGGIGPDNVEDVVAECASHFHVGSFWIDMESGVRTNDEFDLHKVRDVLERTSRLRNGLLNQRSEPA